MHVLGDTFQPVPVGVVGELFIGGVQVARGYVNRPELTAERFLRDPFTTHGRMYRTGDLARWLPTGEIEYLGRTDDQVKIRGFRIELGEVEAALERCPGVAQAVVRVGAMGGFPALEAFLVPRTGTDFSLPVIRVHLAEFLPDAMRPAVYYRLKSIPLSSSGKADRKALQGERLGRLATEASAVQHTPTEQTVLGIWSRIMPEAGIITIDQNFFEIGGSSLLLIRLHEALEEIWPGHFTLAELFVAVTIRQQCERIDGAHQPQTVLPSTRPVGTEDQAIAIIGMALRVGNHDSPDAFWSELLGGGDLTGSLPAARQQELKHMLAAIGIDATSRQFREAAYLDDISGFDCARFGMAPGDARLMDPEQRLFLETALRALEDAGYGGHSLFGAKTGVFAGASPTQTFKEAVSRSFPEQAEQGYILNVPSGMATRLGYIMNWSGPAALVDTACSSSLQAMRDACLSLHRGECDVALVGGSRILLTPLRSESTFAIETTTGHTRTFDAKADGVSAGEGAVVFVLKPLARAKADGDAIRAVILGGAVNQDGRSASIAAPNPVAQGAVIRAAAADAGIDLTSIDFFEAHGTATALGDPIEIDGLTRAFGPENQHQVFIGSVKGNVGHLDAAAGAIGVAKAVLALQHGLVPRQPHFETPNPRIDFAHAPVVVAGENQRLLADRQPWRCGVSAFGLSGINVHLLLEQAPQFAYPEDDGTCFCLPLSAGSAHGLRVYVEKLMLAMAENPSWPLHAIAATLSVGREHLTVRLAFAARTREEFLSALMAWRLGKTTPDFSCAEKKARSAALAFLGGAAPVWPAKRPVYRVHLPSAPLERVRCWPDFVPAHMSGGPGFLGQTVATPQGWLFSVPVGDKAFWPVAEHVLAGTPTMVGMAMVALVAEAMDRIGAKESIVIEGLSWLRPASAAEKTVSGLLSLRKADGSTHAVLSVGHGDDRWDECIEAQVRTVRATPKRRDVAALGEAMQRVPRVKKNPDDGQEHMVQVSTRWDCLRRQWLSADGMESLALLVLPEEFHGDAELTAWHPALLDVAASQILDRPGLVPVSCQSIHLYRPLPPRCFVHAVRHSPGNEKILHGDCCLMNEQGDVLAELSGLVFVPLLRPQAQLHHLAWTEARLTEDSMEPGEILLLGHGPLCTALEEELRHQNRPFRRCRAGKSDAGVGDSLPCALCAAHGRTLPLGSGRAAPGMVPTDSARPSCRADHRFRGIESRNRWRHSRRGLGAGSGVVPASGGRPVAGPIRGTRGRSDGSSRAGGIGRGRNPAGDAYRPGATPGSRAFRSPAHRADRILQR
jgi:3-oxoacyl-(acyl-carrier-protein) synthase